MAYQISAGDFSQGRHLSVDEQGVELQDGPLPSGRRRFRFEEIECVLLSPQGLLSFQVGREVFSIATRRDDRQHQGAIEALVRALKGGA